MEVTVSEPRDVIRVQSAYIKYQWDYCVYNLRQNLESSIICLVMIIWHLSEGLIERLTKYVTGAVFSYKLRYIVGFWLVETAVSTNQKPTIYRNLYENTAPDYLIDW